MSTKSPWLQQFHPENRMKSLYLWNVGTFVSRFSWKRMKDTKKSERYATRTNKFPLIWPINADKSSKGLITSTGRKYLWKDVQAQHSRRHSLPRVTRRADRPRGSSNQGCQHILVSDPFPKSRNIPEIPKLHNCHISQEIPYIFTSFNITISKYKCLHKQCIISSTTNKLLSKNNSV